MAEPKRPSTWTVEGIIALCVAIVSVVGTLCGQGVTYGLLQYRMTQIETRMDTHLAEVKDARTKRDEREGKMEEESRARDVKLAADIADVKDLHGTRIQKLEDNYSDILRRLTDIATKLDTKH